MEKKYNCEERWDSLVWLAFTTFLGCIAGKLAEDGYDYVKERLKR